MGQEPPGKVQPLMDAPENWLVDRRCGHVAQRPSSAIFLGDPGLGHLETQAGLFVKSPRNCRRDRRYDRGMDSPRCRQESDLLAFSLQGTPPPPCRPSSPSACGAMELRAWSLGRWHPDGRAGDLSAGSCGPRWHTIEFLTSKCVRACVNWCVRTPIHGYMPTKHTYRVCGVTKYLTTPQPTDRRALLTAPRGRGLVATPYQR